MGNSSSITPKPAKDQREVQSQATYDSPFPHQTIQMKS